MRDVLLSTQPIYNGPAMVATSPKLANFGAASFAVLEVENIGYTEQYTADGTPVFRRAA